MTFSDDHKRILEKNRDYYDSLQRNGTLNKISSVIIDEFQRVYFEAIGEKKFALWCSACIVELIELCFANYDKFLKDEQAETDARPEPPAEQPKLSKLKNKRKNV